MSRIKKILFILFFLSASHAVYSQIDCRIYPGDTTVCYKETLLLYTEVSDTLRYYWHHSGETTATSTVTIVDTSTFILTVTNAENTLSCNDTITISTYPRMVVEFTQINKGCPGECKSQVQAAISGGFPPYRYVWSSLVAPNDSSLALGLCSEDEVGFRAIDTICSHDTVYLVDAYQLPEIEITHVPDSIYDVNPQATFSFENKSGDSIPITNWSWIFSNGITTNESNPLHVFGYLELDEKDTVLFTYTTADGCNDTIPVEIMLKESTLEIPNVFTPNGDGSNEYFVIKNLERYASNEIVIFNRWGKRVYEANNYDGTWDGGSLSDGTYFYLLRCTVFGGEQVYKGAVTIIGSGN